MEYLENVHELGSEKGLVYLVKHYRKSLARELEISAVLIPEAGEAPEKKKSIPPFTAFAERASSTIFQMPGSEAGTFFEIKSVLEGIPAVRGTVLYKKDDISVVIPVVNSDEYLQEAIDSVLGQTLSAGEILVVDDGSTDNSALKVKSYGKKISIFIRRTVETQRPETWV